MTTLETLAVTVIGALWLAACAMAKVLYNERGRLVKEKAGLAVLLSQREMQIEKLEEEARDDAQRWMQLSRILIRIANEKKVSPDVLYSLEKLF